MTRSPGDRLWASLRLTAAGLGLAAIAAQLAQSIDNALSATTPHGSHVPTVVANFLSFFTIQSNLAAAIVLLVAGLWGWRRGKDAAAEPAGLAVALACASTCMIVTGIVYNTLLRGVELPQGTTVPWSNEVLHVVVPVFLLLDVLVAPKRRALPWWTVGIIAAYPLAWVVYTLARAHLIVGPGSGAPYWYPYPFLDPNLVAGGYLGVAGYILGIAVAIIAVGCLVVWVGRRRAKRRHPSH